MVQADCIAPLSHSIVLVFTKNGSIKLELSHFIVVLAYAVIVKLQGGYCKFDTLCPLYLMSSELPVYYVEVTCYY